MARYPTVRSVGIFYAMKKNFIFRIKSFLLCMISLAALVACNKDGEITIPLKPEISFEQQCFELKLGQNVLLAPMVKNVDQSTTYLWTLQGKSLSTKPEYEFVAQGVGQHLLTFTVTNQAGSTSENVRIVVSELAPPRIEFAVGEDGLFEMVAGCSYTLRADVVSASDYELRWIVDSKPMGTGEKLELKFDQVGDHRLTLEAENEDGKSEKSFTLGVRSYVNDMFHIAQERHVALGRTLYLEPTLWDVEKDQVSFEWIKDGEVIGNASMLKYKAEKLGKESIILKVTSNGETLEREISVECHPAEQESKREVTAESRSECNRVFSYTPGVGQFLNETNSGFAGESTSEQAAAYAERRLKEKNYVSLGAWGGELTVGFDHSVEERFYVGGNFYEGSSEAGIVWVSQDTNLNGLPDDEWYELRGSEWGKPTHARLHAITYYKPHSEQGNIMWRDNKRQMGCVYRNGVHPQPSYYPEWVAAQSYTLYGSWLEQNTVRESSGKYVNKAYVWGYADNEGEDSQHEGAESKVEFRVENAVNIDGTPACLEYVDFVRVQTAICHTAGELGEISTEVTAIFE